MDFVRHVKEQKNNSLCQGSASDDRRKIETSKVIAERVIEEPTPILIAKFDGILTTTMQLTSLVKTVGFRLLPFIKASLIYLLFWLPYFGKTPSAQNIFFKCLPILCLICFVIAYLKGLSRKRYAFSILAGLILSCMGDACLVYSHNWFIEGLLCFALGHIMYAYAFHAKPYRLQMLVFFLPFAASIYAFMLPGFKGALTYLGGVYIILICLMAWRAAAAIQLNMWKWTKIFAFWGAVMFCISDLVLAINKFRFEVPYGDTIVMSTYYTAQLGIALSVVPSEVMMPQKQRRESNGHLTNEHVKAIKQD